VAVMTTTIVLATQAVAAGAVGTGSAAHAKGFNSCSVVTQSEAASALGEPVTKGVLGKATVEGGLACVFYGPHSPFHNPNIATGDSVRVVVVKGSNAKKYYLNYRSTVKAVAVSGYGDQAFWDGFASLSVLKGDAYLRIAVAPFNAVPSLKGAEKLAKDILPKL
jgi:hypothetical protein